MGQRLREARPVVGSTTGLRPNGTESLFRFENAAIKDLQSIFPFHPIGKCSKRATAFKRDFRRVLTNPRDRDADKLLQAVLDLLVADRPLPPSNRDHALSGDWINYRECHLRPDLLLIYRKPDAETLQLVRLGSHSELFG